MKRLITILVVAVMLVSLVACTAQPAEESSAAAESQAPAETSAAAETEAEASGDGEYTIGVTLMDYNFTFFQDMLAMMKKTAEENGVTIVDYDAKQDATQQLNDVQDMINALKVDVIVLNPVDSSAIVPAVLDANDAGIPVITVDVGADSGDVVSHISSDNTEIGRMEAEYLVDKLTEKNGDATGTVAVITYPQITSMRQREEGFLEVMANYPDIEIINKSPIQVTAEDTMSLIEDLLTTYPEGTLDAIDATNSTTCLGVIAALQSANRNDVFVVGTDEDVDVLAEIADPDSFVLGAVVQYPTEMGRLAIENAVAILNGETVEPKISTLIEMVDKDNVADFDQKKEEINAEIAPYK